LLIHCGTRIQASRTPERLRAIAADYAEAVRQYMSGIAERMLPLALNAEVVHGQAPCIHYRTARPGVDFPPTARYCMMFPE
jgi:hypothetical protein